MADEADSRPAGPTTAAARECLVWGGYSLDVVFLPCPLFLQAATAVRFEGAGGSVDGMVPSTSVSSLGSPVPWVDAAASEGLLQRIFVTLPLCSSVAVARRQFSHRNSVIFGRRWSGILKTCPAQCSCVFRRVAARLVIPAFSRTSTLVT